jgi:hypothetical protein
MEDIKPLLARIQALKSGSGGALSGTQLMSFFLQRRVQPLQHRISKLWSYSGLKDSSRVFEEDIDKKDLDKRVRSLTTLTKDHDIPALAADFFDSERPLPSVRAFSLHRFYSPCSCNVATLLIVLWLYFCRAINSLFLVLLCPSKDLFRQSCFCYVQSPRGRGKPGWR